MLDGRSEAAGYEARVLSDELLGGVFSDWPRNPGDACRVRQRLSAPADPRGRRDYRDSCAGKRNAGSHGDALANARAPPSLHQGQLGAQAENLLLPRGSVPRTNSELPQHRQWPHRAIAGHSKPLNKRSLTSDHGISLAEPLSSFSTLRRISASQAAAAPGSSSVSRLSIKAPATEARSASSSANACFSTSLTVGLMGSL